MSSGLLWHQSIRDQPAGAGDPAGSGLCHVPPWKRSVEFLQDFYISFSVLTESSDEDEASGDEGLPGDDSDVSS